MVPTMLLLFCIEKKFRIDSDEESEDEDSIDGDELLTAGMRQWTRT